MIYLQFTDYIYFSQEQAIILAWKQMVQANKIQIKMTNRPVSKVASVYRWIG